MLDNPFRKQPEGLDPNDAEFLAKFGGKEEGGNTAKPTPKMEEEPSPDEALNLGVTAEQREAFLNELVDIAHRFRIPRREHEAVVELFKRINKELDDEKMIMIEDVTGDRTVKMIQVKENHVICLNLTGTPIQSLDGITFPEGLKKLYLSYCDQLQSPDGITLPKGLISLDLRGTPVKSLYGVTLPQGLQTLNLSTTPIQSLSEVNLPEGLQIDLNGTPLSQNPKKMAELEAKNPNVKFIY